MLEVQETRQAESEGFHGGVRSSSCRSGQNRKRSLTS
jgi:hypothetical protein